MQLYRNKYRSDSFRLQNWDYGSPGFYYVTICTKHHYPYFGEVVALDKLSGNTRAWDGLRDGIAGTHDYASLPPTAHPAPSPTAPPAHGQRESAVFVKLSAIGKIAYENWLAIPQHFPFVALDEFVVMPDHLHGILCFRKPGYRQKQFNVFGPQSQNLGSVIRNYKGATKGYAKANNIEFAWQVRYHDDVITSSKELNKIRKYIKENPARWIERQRLNLQQERPMTT